MTRANLLIVTVLTVGLAGMFFWTLSLHNEQARLSGGGAEMGPAGDGMDHERRLRELEGASDAQGQELDSIRVALARTGERVTEVESSVARQRDQLASLTGAGSGGGSVAAGAGETVLRDTIEEVLAKKEEEDQKARIERMARGMSRFLLNEIDATDEQRDRFVQVIASYFSKRNDIRERFSGENADDQLRDQEVERLDATRDGELGQIFSAGDLATIQERLERGSRWMGGGRQGGGRSGASRSGGGAPGGGGRPR